MRAQHAADGFPTYAKLMLDGRMLLLAQSEVHILEPRTDIVTDTKPSEGVGLIPLEGGQWPVYCLDGNLEVLSDIPTTRRVCVLLNKENGYFGLLCDDFTTLRRDTLKLHPLPACMKIPGSPLEALVIHGNEIGLISTVARLEAFFQRLPCSK